MFTSDGVQSVLFDLDGTLRHSKPAFNQFFFEIAVQFGLQDSAEKRTRSARWLHYYWAQSPEMLSDKQKYDHQEDDFWINHMRLNLIAFGAGNKRAGSLAPKVFNHIKDNYDPEDWVPPDVPETLSVLKDAGYKLALASNRSEPYTDQLEDLRLSSYFDFALAAGEINSWKPNPKIFLEAAQKLEAEPHQIIYVGDNYYADVVGAERAGIQPILYDINNVFPEVNCAVIKSIGELTELLLDNKPP